MIRRHMVFRGKVSNVGFGERVVRMGGIYDCTGWVREEDDGSVSMEIQGTETEIAFMIAAIERGEGIEVDHQVSFGLAPDKQEIGFREYDE